jgi:hemerythrin-like domain-containing protein
VAKERSNDAATDIYELLKQDHRAVADLFKRIEASSERAGKSRAELFGKLSSDLLAHAHAEQATFYTALLDRVEDREALLEAFEEHGVVEKVVKDIESCDPSDERWLAKLIVLKEMVEHHVEEEESEIFKMAKKEFSEDEARALAEEMRERKAEERA